VISSEKVLDRGAALTSRLQTFETEMLGEEEDFAGLGRLNRALIGKAEAMDSRCRAVLDVDSTEIPAGRILLWLGMPKWKSWVRSSSNQTGDVLWRADPLSLS
jgi:hypothetical protein